MKPHLSITARYDRESMPAAERNIGRSVKALSEAAQGYKVQRWQIITYRDFSIILRQWFKRIDLRAL